MFDMVMNVLHQIEWIYWLFAFVFAATIGSFLNVVIYRVPTIQSYKDLCETQDYMLDAFSDFIKNPEKLEKEMEDLREKYTGYNIVTSPSKCPKCNCKINFLHNLPIISWLYLRGRCNNCGCKISYQYPLVEAVSGLLILGLAITYEPSLDFVVYSLLTLVLVAISGIDFHHKYIPDVITIPFIWLGLFYNAIYNPNNLADFVFAAVFGYLLIYVVERFGVLILKKDIIGLGDAKLLAMLGAWLGLSTMLFSLYLAVTIGMVIAIVLIISKRYQRSSVVAFGPCISLGAYLVLLVRDYLYDFFNYLISA